MSAPASTLSSDAASLGSGTTDVYIPRRGLSSEVVNHSLVLTRWSGSGSRRLYVNAPDGSHVGWADPDTGANSLVLREFGADFVRALSEASLEDLAASYVPRRGLADPIQAGDTSQLAASAPPVVSRPETQPTTPLPPVRTRASRSHPAVATVMPQHSLQTQAPAPVPPSEWAAPVGPPFVADLAANRAGQQLQGQIDAAHQLGQRPTVVRRILHGKKAYSSWELGAIGERLVAVELTRLVSLGRGWAFLNSVPVGSNHSDIDHLVVGPGGVFTLNAKHHSGARIWVGGNTVMVNGVRQPYVRNSRFEAQRAGKLLSVATGISVPVRGLIVPVRAESFTVKQQPEDVNVVIRSRLVQYLVNQRVVLDAAAIERVFGFARLSSTWGH